MLKLRSVFSLLCFVLIFSSAAAASGRRRWQTLNGTEPWVIARAGFSGLFPESSRYAYTSALQFGSPNSLLWCDVQLTRDGDGICSPSINLQNVSLNEFSYNLSRTYLVNNVPTTAYFSSDFTSRQLQSISLKQGIYSRPPYFDNTGQTFLNVMEVFNPPQGDPLPNGLWLSVPHDQFFRQRNLSMTRYILSVSRSVTITYISSPEVEFLRSVASLRTTTKRVFQVLDREAVEPTLNITYDTLLGNLTFIRTFADGILVHKKFIWPLDNSLYLQNYASLVLDAHRADLEVFASGFANDATMAYDYNYDPVSEYLSFIDNGQYFS